MDLTRRTVARMLAVAAAAPQAGVAQTPADADLESAREVMKTNTAQIAKVKLPIATEPAFHFKA